MKLSFDLHLPFLIPFKEGLKYASAYPSADFLLKFNSYKRLITIDDEYLYEDKECTVVEIIFMPHEEMTKDVEIDEILKLTVVNSIHYLNVLFDALRINHNLNYIYNITIADLPLIITIEINDEEAFSYITKPQDVLLTPLELGKDDLRKFGGVMQLRDTHPEVFLVEKFYASARSRLYKEQMIEAIIDLQTSFEIFIRNTHKLILLKKNTSEVEVNNASNISFRNVVEDHIGRLLGENLNFNSSSGPINDWYKKLYIVRNEIVHQGRVEVSGNEAYEAHDAYVNARNYLADLLNNAGYLNANKKVDLNIFSKNIKGALDGDELLKRLKERGLVAKDLKNYKTDTEE